MSEASGQSQGRPPDFAAVVAAYEAALLARGLQTEGAHSLRASAPLPVVPAPAVVADAPVALLFSPHPDDEVITGAAALRLRQESNWRVVNIAVTLGSKTERRASRWAELQDACAHLDFELHSATGEDARALTEVHPARRTADPAGWAALVAPVRGWIERLQPRVIVAPHLLDGHGAHIGTALLVRDALAQAQVRGPVHVLGTEYWNTQLEPALMVQVAPAMVAQLMQALALHVGEVARNPYHLSLPAWFIDSARRGAERVMPPGSAATGCSFASLYGWWRWDGNALVPMPARLARSSDRLADCFEG